MGAIGFVGEKGPAAHGVPDGPENRKAERLALMVHGVKSRTRGLTQADGSIFGAVLEQSAEAPG